MNRFAWLLVGLLLCACGDDDPGGGDGGVTCTSNEECDDGVFCNGLESCDSVCVAGAPPCVGEMCDEATEACVPRCDMVTDADGDGADAIECGGTDCDDSDPRRFPGNPEICDPDDHDEDCDDTTYGYRDSDGDGYGDAACCNGDNCGDDCNDMSAATHPGEAESCDGADNDCDGTVDETVLRTFYVDGDDDGRGDDTQPTMAACFPPEGYSELAGDCDDADPGRHDGLPEVCDAAGVDENCDGVANPDDLCSCDGSDSRACLLPGYCSGGVEVCSGGMWGECSRTPRLEVCNAVDDNCDGRVDEGLTVECFADPDDDGFAIAGTMATMACPEGGRSEVGGCPVFFTNRRPLDPDLDCAEDRPDRFPGAAELCNGEDDDCDGVADEGLTVVIRYVDADGDGFEGSPVMRCEGDPDSVAVSSDCNESDTSVYIGAPELCDGKDNNCSFGGAAAGGPDIFEDEDGDGYTLATIGDYCSGGPFPKTDCNDDPMNNGADDNAGMPETCNGRDTDCDGSIDEDPAAYDSCTAPNASAGCAHDGDCGIFACDFGFADCNGDYVDGCEADTRVDTLNCGGCGVTCAGGTCDDGVCPSVAAVATTPGHSCLLFADGSIGCGGEGDSGQLGTGARSDHLVVGSGGGVVGITGASAVSVSGAVSCAVVAGGVSCWGSGFSGQLGNGTNTRRQLTPTPVTGLTGTPVDVAVTGRAVCALTDTGTVECWGDNGTGQLGDAGAGPSTNTPVVVSGITDAVALSGHGNVSGTFCVVRSGGGVLCWGRNERGQAGDGGVANPTAPVAVTGVSNAVDVAVGNLHACALLANETVTCWGNARFGQLGDGTVNDATYLAQPVTGLTEVISLDTGSQSSCAVSRNGAATRTSCWGWSEYGAIGNGSFARTAVPTPFEIPGLTDGIQVSVGELQVCLLREGDKVSCWGNAGAGSLLTGDLTSHATPVRVRGLPVASEVASQNFFACGRRSTGSVACWGVSPSEQPDLVGLVARDISTGNEHGCAVLDDGTLWCWGKLHGPPVRPFFQVTGVSDVVRVEGGFEANCAQERDGSLHCWGTNGVGQVGDGTTVRRDTPVEIAITDVTDFAMGRGHTCATVRSGDLYCWGVIPPTALTPTLTSPISDAVRVVAGNGNTCVLRASGEVWCFGSFLSGNIPSSAPVRADLPPGRVVDLSGGLAGGHFCAVLDTGAAYCWDSANSYGQIGDGTFSPVTDPTLVGGYMDFVRITSSGPRSCGIRDSFGAVACWGRGGYLGDGTTNPSAVPVDVINFP